MKYYLVCVYDYIKRETFVLAQKTDKYNALEIMQSSIYNVIEEKEGSQKNITKIFNKNDKGRPFGYYIYRDSQKNPDMLKIKRKHINKGYLYNETICETIFSFFIVKRLDDKLRKNMSIENIIIDDYNQDHKIHHISCMRDVFDELLEKIKINEEN